MELSNLKEKILYLEKELNEIKKIINLNEKSLIETNTVKTEEKKDEFSILKELLLSDKWPSAVDPDLICNINLEQNKEDRAEGIIDLIFDINLKNLNILDFGCGEGHVTKKFLNHDVKKSIGYDIIKSNNWKDQDQNLLFTTDWAKIKENGPYDAILVYDVLDHIEGTEENVKICLNKIKEVSNNNTLIYVRCHPFCSRHATHLYHQLNKAFIHLVFTKEEQDLLELKPLNIRKVIHPLLTYKSLFSDFTFHKKEQIYKEKTENFFIENPLISKRIKSHWKNSHDLNLREGKTFPLIQLEQQFVDYCLKIK